MVHHSENDSIKYHEQKFCIKFAFQGSIEQDYLSKHVKIQFLGCHKISIPVLNLNTESAKELKLYDLLFLIPIYASNNDNKHPSEMRN